MGKGSQLGCENGDWNCSGEHAVGYTEAELLKKFYIYIGNYIWVLYIDIGVG